MAHPLNDVPSQAEPSLRPYEEAILAIWRDTLGRPDIGVSDDFFDLDGDSLHAIRVIARIREALGVGIRAMDFFESPTVAALAAAVAAARPAEEGAVIGRRPGDAEPVLSFDQQRLWVEDQLLTGAAYHVHGRQRLLGALDVAALDGSVRAILQRHEVLRSRFPTVDDRPVQVVDDLDDAWHITVEDLAGLGAGRDEAARRLMDREAAEPFDLARGPLVRCLLIRLGEAEHVLSVTAHHIVCDDWSVGLFGRELAALYRAGGDPARSGLPALEIQYGDYAVWQRERLVGEVLEEQVGYWRDHLRGAPAALALPSRRWRPLHDVPGAGRVRAELSERETADLHDLCRRHGVTPFMALLASFGAVLGRWSGQRDLVIGAPITGRTDAGTGNLIGFFVNTLPLRVDLGGEPTFAELLDRVRQCAVGGFAHADAPLDVLVRELPAPRVPGRTPLFQAILNVVGSPEAQPLEGLTSELLDTPVRSSKFELACTAREWDGVLRLDLEFDADRYEEAMLRALLEQLRALLRAAVEDPAVGVLDCALGEERAAAAPAGAPAADPLRAVERFARLPDRPAVVAADGQWSYRGLDAAADRVAQALAERFPDGSGQYVAVVRRSTGGFVAAVLGCLRAGTVFSVVDDAGTALLLGMPTVLDPAPEGEVPGSVLDLTAVLGAVPTLPVPVLPESAPPRAADPGAPGDWAVERYGLRAQDRFTVLSEKPGQLLSALSSAFEAGATLVLPDRSSAGDPEALLDWLEAAAISVVQLTPPVLRALAARPRPLPALRYAFVENTGDLLAHDVEALRRLSAACRLVSLYRIAPDGRPAAAHQVPEDWKREDAPLRVPLGTEVTGPARLLHPSGVEAAVGEVAEICFDGLRTGDLGRRWLDGSLEFVGDSGTDPGADLTEAVGVLRGLPEVGDALVTEWLEADGSSVLVGYVACGEGTAEAADIRQRLVARLPDRLVPAHLVLLDRLPLTGAGDYDLGGFPRPDTESAPLDRYVAPRTPLEQRLVEILTELLGADQIGVHDSFFELGGFSLLATQLNGRIRESVGVELTLRDVFESATVDVLAQRIVRAQAEQASAADVEALLAELEADLAAPSAD